MEELCNISKGLSDGIGHLLTYDNITICILVFIVFYAGYWINKLLAHVFAVKDALQDVRLTISVLNERLDHHKEDKDDA